MNRQRDFIPAKAQKVITRIQMKKMIDWIIAPPIEFGEDPISGRDTFLVRSLDEARKINVISALDETKYFVSCVEPADPEVGINT